MLIITYNPTGEPYGVTIQIKTETQAYRRYVDVITAFETPSDGGFIIVMDGEGAHGEPYDRWWFDEGEWKQTLDQRDPVTVVSR